MISFKHFALKFILIVIYFINRNKFFANGQLVSSNVTSVTGITAPSSLSIFPGRNGFLSKPLLNNIKQLFGANGIRNLPNVYNAQSYALNGFQDQQSIRNENKNNQNKLYANSQGYSQSWQYHENNVYNNRPNINSNIYDKIVYNNDNKRPVENNFYQTTKIPKRVAIQSVTNFNRPYEYNPTLLYIVNHLSNPQSWNTEPLVSTSQSIPSEPWSSNQESLISEPADNPLSVPVSDYESNNNKNNDNDNLIGEQDKAGLTFTPIPQFPNHNTDSDNKDSLTFAPIPNHNTDSDSLTFAPASKDNDNLISEQDKAGPTFAPIPQIPDQNTDSGNEDNLISEAAANPLSVPVSDYESNNNKNNDNDNLISEQDKAGLTFAPFPNHNIDSVNEDSLISDPEETSVLVLISGRPGLIINPDSPYYIAKASGKSSQLFDERRY